MYMPILRNCYKDLQLVNPGTVLTCLKPEVYLTSVANVVPLLLGIEKEAIKSLSQLYWSTTIMAFELPSLHSPEAFLICLRAHLYSPPSISLPTSCGWFQSNCSQEYLVYSHLHVANGGEPHIGTYRFTSWSEGLVCSFITLNKS